MPYPLGLREMRNCQLMPGLEPVVAPLILTGVSRLSYHHDKGGDGSWWGGRRREDWTIDEEEDQEGTTLSKKEYLVSHKVLLLF